MTSPSRPSAPAGTRMSRMTIRRGSGIHRRRWTLEAELAWGKTMAWYTSSTAGPEMRKTATPALPAGVASANMVLSLGGSLDEEENGRRATRAGEVRRREATDGPATTAPTTDLRTSARPRRRLALARAVLIGCCVWICPGEFFLAV